MFFLTTAADEVGLAAAAAAAGFLAFSSPSLSMALETASELTLSLEGVAAASEGVSSEARAEAALRSSAFLGRGGWSEASAEDILGVVSCGFGFLVVVVLVDLFCLYEVGAWERKAVGGW